MQLTLNHNDVQALAQRAAQAILAFGATLGRTLLAYPVPRGGVPVAYLLQGLAGFSITDDPEKADIFIDDLIDSGSTMEHWCDQFPGKPFFVLIDKKTDEAFKGRWIVFPWEGDAESGIEDNIRRLLQYVGDDPAREGLLETPHRVAKAWRHWCGGYGKDPKAILKVFEDGAEKHDQMVTVRDIPIYSHCEHHLAPIFGTVTISYIPNGRIVGLSKLSRLADMYARRLQVQERLTDQIADALFEHLEAKGVGVVIKARHMCMESRGICQQGHHTVTTALRGAMKDEPDTRAEFLRLAQ